jgi:hypothetical protein
MKCPNCNSSRYHLNDGKSCCDRCGFENIGDKNNPLIQKKKIILKKADEYSDSGIGIVQHGEPKEPKEKFPEDILERMEKKINKSIADYESVYYLKDPAGKCCIGENDLINLINRLCHKMESLKEDIQELKNDRFEAKNNRSNS